MECERAVALPQVGELVDWFRRPFRRRSVGKRGEMAEGPYHIGIDDGMGSVVRILRTYEPDRENHRRLAVACGRRQLSPRP